MTDGPEWFAPKRYGYGAGLPIRWQGWALTIACVLAALLVGQLLKEGPLVMYAILALVISTFVVIAARTTRGGWRWRWGGDEE